MFKRQNLFFGKLLIRPLLIHMPLFNVQAVRISIHATNRGQPVTTFPKITRQLGHERQQSIIIREHERRPSFRTQGTPTTSQQTRFFNMGLCRARIYIKKVRLCFSTPREHGEPFAYFQKNKQTECEFKLLIDNNHTN